jgi:hypothetical protein
VTVTGALPSSTREARIPGAMPLAEFIAASGLRALVLATSKDPNRKITVLLVPPSGGRALLAIKVPTTAIAARAVETERRMLADLRWLAAIGELRGVPSVHGRVSHDGWSGLVVTALDGVPMTTSYLRWRHTARPACVRPDFAAVGAWLAGFQRATAGPAAPVDLAGAAATALRRRFAQDPLLEADLERLDRLDAILRREAVPRTAVHGDFWPGNILLADGRVSGVVDWEAGSVSGEPVRDLVRFAHMYALYLDCRTARGRRVMGHPGLRAREWGSGVAYAFEGGGWFPDLFRGFLRDGLRRLGASPDCWRAAALAGIAEVAALTDDLRFARLHLELFRRLGVNGGRIP